MTDLSRGRWVTVGLIRRWVSDYPPCEGCSKPCLGGLCYRCRSNLRAAARIAAQVRYVFDDQELRDAHAAYNRGVRLSWSRTGENLYRKSRKRRVWLSSGDPLANFGLISRSKKPRRLVKTATISRSLDTVAIDRFLDGDRSIDLTREERVEAIRRWCDRGLSQTELVRQTGWNVSRYLRSGAA